MNTFEKLYEVLEHSFIDAENSKQEFWHGYTCGLMEAMVTTNRIERKRTQSLIGRHEAIEEEVEKVLLGLECCSKNNSCNACPCQKIASCSIRVMQDSKALIQKMKTLMEDKLQMTKLEKLYDILEHSLKEASERKMNEAEDVRLLYHWAGYEDGLREALIAIDRLERENDA